MFLTTHTVAISLLLFSNVYALEEIETFLLGHRNGEVVLPPPQESRDLSLSARIDLLTFQQKLDHFDLMGSETFNQRYLQNVALYNETNRKFFLFIGGESAISVGWMQSGEWYRLGIKYGAAMFQLEHRYYGTSHPFSDTSTPNLKYLSSRQAIEDIAYFITSINNRYNLTSDEADWVLFGGSYAGSLVAWVRQKYPHLVRGGVSSSGPLLALLDFYDYYGTVSESIAAIHSQQCADIIRLAIEYIDELFVNRNTTGIDSLISICGGSAGIIDSEINSAVFFQVLQGIFASPVQYHGLYDTGIPEYCNFMVNTAGSEVEKLSALIKALYPNACFSANYQNIITNWGNTAISESSLMRQWFYQTCTEFGFYQTSHGIFGSRVKVDFYTRLCDELFGNLNFAANDRMDATNIYFGEQRIEVTNVIFVNGKIDPWHPLSVLETKHCKAPAIVLNETSHCVDMYTLTDSDSNELKETKNRIEEFIELILTTDRDDLGCNGSSTIYFNLWNFMLLISVSIVLKK